MQSFEQLVNRKQALVNDSINLVKQAIKLNNYELLIEVINRKLLSYFKVAKFTIEAGNIKMFIKIISYNDYNIDLGKAYNLFNFIASYVTTLSNCTVEELTDLCDELSNLDIDRVYIFRDFVIYLNFEQFQAIYNNYTISPNLKTILSNIDNLNGKWVKDSNF